jgi:hypothetical protein
VATAGVVEHLRKSPEQWEFLLRLENGEAVNVELRGAVHGVLSDGDEVVLLESRVVRAHEVTVARRVRNETTRSAVVVTGSGWRRKVVDFIVPRSIWTPIGGLGATALTLAVTRDDQQAAPAIAPESPSDDGSSPLVPVLIAAALVVLLVMLVAFRRTETPRLAVFLIAGVLIGVAIRLALG